jgi:hypothetical protein
MNAFLSIFFKCRRVFFKEELDSVALEVWVFATKNGLKIKLKIHCKWANLLCPKAL